MRRLLREPLLHFLLLGGAIFLAYGLLPRSGSAEAGKIVITQGQIDHLAATFARARQRQPSEEELADLVRDRIREEVYCREAIALGLDRDDTVIRRRLLQKMEFVSEDVGVLPEPTDAELAGYLASHPSSFRVEPRVTFRQVYLNPDKHGENLARDAARLLARLNKTGPATDSSELGDVSLLPQDFAAASTSEVGRQFGEEFAAKLDSLAAGKWWGPVGSPYGVHLVVVAERTEGRLPALAEVRDDVRREWSNARQLERNEAFYAELLKRYTVTVEAASAQKVAVAQ